MSFDVGRLGLWTDADRHVVDPDRTIAYAAATNDPLPAHRSGALAPPVFAVVPVWPILTGVLAAMVDPDVAATILHREHDVWIHEPLVPGSTVVSRGRAVGIQRNRVGATVVVQTVTHDADGQRLLNEQYAVLFFRAPGGGESRGEEAPNHRTPSEARAATPTAVVSQTFDLDQTFRYAAASGDDVPIHLDESAARAVGLPGIIVHGLCTMATLSWAAIEHLAGADPTRLRRLAVRFSRPVRPGDTVTTRFLAAPGVPATAYAFETTNGAGEGVVKDGLVQVTP